MRTGTATATTIATGIVAVIIPIHTAATTNAVLPAANSARAPVGSVVVDDDAIPADALEASPLSPSGAMDPTAAATTKTLSGDGDSSDGNGNGSNGDGNVDGSDGGDGNGDGNGQWQWRWRRRSATDATVPSPNAAWMTPFSAWRTSA